MQVLIEIKRMQAALNTVFQCEQPDAEENKQFNV